MDDWTDDEGGGAQSRRQPETAEEIWSEAAGYVRAEAAAGRHPMLSEFPWRMRALPTAPFIASVAPELATATTLRVPAVDNGLFANVLQVLDAALVASDTGAKLDIDWVRREDATDFTYAKAGVDVFAKLFETPKAAKRNPPAGVRETAATVLNRLNPLLLAPSRGLYFSASFFNRHRRTYAKVFAATFRPRKKLRNALEPMRKRFADVRAAGGRVIGLHCRMSTAAVSNAQSTGLARPCSSRAALVEISGMVGEKDMLFVATDSATDAAALTKLLGRRCALQGGGGVSRAADDELIETHQRAGGSLKKAYAALIDSWLLAACDEIVHNTESNVVMTAAFVNPSVPLTPLGEGSGSTRRHGGAGRTLAPPQDAARLLVGTIEYEDAVSGGPMPEMVRPWTLVYPRSFRVKKNALRRFLVESRPELVKSPTAADPKATTIIFFARRLDGTVFPKPEDLSAGRIDPQLVCLAQTRALRKALGERNHDMHGAVLQLLRVTHAKTYSTENIALELGSDGTSAANDGGVDDGDEERRDGEDAYGEGDENYEDDGDGAAGKIGSSSSSSSSSSASSFSGSSGGGRARNVAEPGAAEARRLGLGDGILPDVIALRDALRREDAYERRPYLHHGSTSAVTALLSVAEALAEEPFPPPSPETTRFRLNPPPTQRGLQFTHNVAFYRNGFYRLVDKPKGSLQDGTFPGRLVNETLSRGEAVVFRYAHQWSPGAAAVVDAIASAFRRRSNINAYMSGAGAATAMDAHNDAHCVVIFQLSGHKRWRIWTREDKLLPTAEVHTDGRMVASPRYQYGIDGSAPDVDALGEANFTFVLRPGDVLYVPRGAIHHTSTAVEGHDSKRSPPSMHFTAALPMDHQSLPWGMGVAPGPGVEQHPYLTNGLRLAAERLLANDIEMRRSLKPLGDDSGLDATLRSGLHATIDEMFDHTDFVEQVRRKFSEWDTIALKRGDLDTMVATKPV